MLGALRAFASIIGGLWASAADEVLVRASKLYAIEVSTQNQCPMALTFGCDIVL
jgi:hypothetical protein